MLRHPGRSRFTLATGLAAVALVSLCLAGCTGPKEWIANGFKVGPNYGAPAAPTSEAWIEANDPRLKTSAEDNARWWTVFNDPALDTLIASASEQNPTLRTAGLRILEARAERGIAAGNLFPQQQGVGAAYSRDAMSATAYPFNAFSMPKYTYDDWSANMNIAWELDFWGRFRRAVEAADAHLDAQVEGYDHVLVLLQAEVAATYIQLRACEERLELARKNVALQKETLRILTLRVRGKNLSSKEKSSNLVRVARSARQTVESGASAEECRGGEKRSGMANLRPSGGPNWRQRGLIRGVAAASRCPLPLQHAGSPAKTTTGSRIRPLVPPM